jgi:group I intron endonuclease
VPTQKYSKFTAAIKPLNHKMLWPVRTYSTSTNKEQDQHNTNKPNFNKDSINPLVYVNAYSMKKTILKENTGKSGIYMLTNLLTGDMYIGQSTDLSKRFRRYFTISYIKSRKELIISRALIKYGYANFSVSILEYCDRCDLTVREQHYMDKFNPQYNILKIAGSSLGFKQSEETKLKISKALKGVYIGDKSPLFGSFHTEETKKRMSLSKAGENNPLYGKTHSEDTKKLMSQRALSRKHSCETKDKMSKTHGNPVNIYEKCSSKGFELIGSFVSARRAAKFLGISGSTVIRYMQSGAIFKDKYKFSSK